MISPRTGDCHLSPPLDLQIYVSAAGVPIPAQHFIRLTGPYFGTAKCCLPRRSAPEATLNYDAHTGGDPLTST